MPASEPKAESSRTTAREDDQDGDLKDAVDSQDAASARLSEAAQQSGEATAAGTPPTASPSPAEPSATVAAVTVPEQVPSVGPPAGTPCREASKALSDPGPNKGFVGQRLMSSSMASQPANSWDPPRGGGLIGEFGVSPARATMSVGGGGSSGGHSSVLGALAEFRRLQALAAAPSPAQEEVPWFKKLQPITSIRPSEVGYPLAQTEQTLCNCHKCPSSIVWQSIIL